MEIILKYFKNLSEEQIRQLSALYDLYLDWNSKINVISRKDIVNLYEKHVLHSLSIAKLINFRDGSRVLDVGTGGGFPGIPLAIMFPNVSFMLVDSIGKKIKVATEVASAIGLSNVSLRQCRVEEEKGKYDFVVSRGVMPLPELISLTKKNVDLKSQKNSLPNGFLCLKGGELNEEVRPFKNIASTYSLANFFEEEFFKTKKIIYVPFT